MVMLMCVFMRMSMFVAVVMPVRVVMIMFVVMFMPVLVFMFMFVLMLMFRNSACRRVAMIKGMCMGFPGVAAMSAHAALKVKHVRSSVPMPSNAIHI